MKVTSLENIRGLAISIDLTHLIGTSKKKTLDLTFRSGLKPFYTNISSC